MGPATALCVLGSAGGEEQGRLRDPGKHFGQRAEIVGGRGGSGRTKPGQRLAGPGWCGMDVVRRQVAVKLPSRIGLVNLAFGFHVSTIKQRSMQTTAQLERTQSEPPHSKFLLKYELLIWFDKPSYCNADKV